VGGVIRQAKYNFSTHAYEYRDIVSESTIAMGHDTREDLTDHTGNRSAYQGCAHTRRRDSYINGDLASCFAVPWIQQGSYYTIGRSLGKITGLCYPTSAEPALLDLRSKLPSIDWPSLVSSGGNALSGEMTASTNMLVNIAQMSQTIRMFANPYGLLRGNWRRAAKKLSARQLSKAGANVWLETRYGWQNLYRDIRAVARVKREVQQHMQYLQQTEGAWVSTGSRQVDAYDTPTTVSSQTNGSNTFRWDCNLYKRVANFSFDVYRHASARRFSEMDLIAQRLGTNDLLEAMWDALPFSFCVDWFFDISDIVARDPIFWDQSRMRQMGYSVKESWECQYFIDTTVGPYNGQQSSSSIESLNQTVLSKYERTSGFPQGTGTSGFFGGLNLIHLADGCALVAQKLC